MDATPISPPISIVVISSMVRRHMDITKKLVQKHARITNILLCKTMAIVFATTPTKHLLVNIPFNQIQNVTIGEVLELVVLIETQFMRI